MSTRDTVLRISQELGATPAQQTLYLHIMRAESAGHAGAKNPKSSATGIFQFLEQTWLEQMHQHGAEHGYGRYADAIYRGSDDKYHVRDGMRTEILNLRNDPVASTRMMHEFTEGNRASVRRALNGREPTAGELYLAHFAGAGGARRILTANPATPLTELMSRKELEDNPSIAHLTAGGLRAWAIGKMDGNVDAVIRYEASNQHSREAADAQRRRRRQTLQGFGMSEEQVDAVDEQGDLMGVGFILVLGALIGALSGISQDDAVTAITEPVAATAGGPVAREWTPQQQAVVNAARAQAAARPDLAVPETDPGIAAAVAGVPASMAGQRPAAASPAENPTLLPVPDVRVAQAPTAQPALAVG